MSILSQRSLRSITRDYAARFAVAPQLIDEAGRPAHAKAPRIAHLPVLVQPRAHGLRESVRWGEPYIFFLAPSIISWVVPLVDGYELRGGLVGGEVVAEDSPKDRHEAVDHLVRGGAAPAMARPFVAGLPAWPLGRTQEAADRLFQLAYDVTGWRAPLLEEHRERARQQRQIAEAISRGKQGREGSPLFDAERVLLSLIRAGDHRGARARLNEILGAVFLRSANLAVVRALMIEMMGYLVRTAVEDSPHLEPLIEENHHWMERVINAPDFETLAEVLRAALDDFMMRVYREGYQPTNPAVRRALDYIDTHFREAVRLNDVADAAGLSTYRLSHLLKRHTGRSMVQHLHHRRVREAQRLLTETADSCADIAYAVGFGDQSYFTQQFRRITGITPLKHRQLYR